MWDRTKQYGELRGARGFLKHRNQCDARLLKTLVYNENILKTPPPTKLVRMYKHALLYVKVHKNETLEVGPNLKELQKIMKNILDAVIAHEDQGTY